MSNNWKNTEKERRIVHGTIQRIERIHPFKTTLFIAMGASGILWLFLLGGYAFSFANANNTGLTISLIPKAFIISSMLLLVSSYSISGLAQAFDRDEPKNLVRRLGATLVLTVLFAIGQLVGWLELLSAGIDNDKFGDSTYFYVLSGLHIVHVVAGLAGLVYVFIYMLYHTADPVKNLILVTNPFQRLKLELLTNYWHFMNATWGILFLYFLIIF